MSKEIENKTTSISKDNKPLREKEVYFGSKDELNYMHNTKLSSLIKIHSGKDYKHLNNGNVPVYGSGGLMCFVDKPISDHEDAIGIGRKGSIEKIHKLKYPFWTVDTLFWCTSKGYNLSYLKYLIETINLKRYDEGSTLPSLSSANIKKIPISIHSENVVEKISAKLSQIDNLIIKQNLKIKAFNKNNSLIINMLINSSNTNQKKITFNSFFNKEEKKIYVEDNIQYKQLTITNKGDILVRGYNFGRDIGRKRQYIFKYESNVNKLLFIRQGIFNGGIGFAENSSLDNAIVTENMPILVIDESIVSSLFFKYYLKSMQYRREVLYFLKPTGSAQSAIHEKDWLKSNDYFPDLETQIKTANYLSQMDKLIEIEEKKLEKLTEMKKYFLQQFFD